MDAPRPVTDFSCVDVTIDERAYHLLPRLEAELLRLHRCTRSPEGQLTFHELPAYRLEELPFATGKGLTP